jgi:hypothetical protein
LDTKRFLHAPETGLIMGYFKSGKIYYYFDSFIQGSIQGQCVRIAEKWGLKGLWRQNYPENEGFGQNVLWFDSG